MQLDGRRTGLGRTRYFFSCRFITYIQKSQKLSVVTLCVDATRRDAFKASARRSLYVSSVQLWVYSNRGGSLEHVFPAKHRRSTFYIYSTKQASERTMGVYVYVYIVTVLNRFCRLSAPYEDIPITLSKGPYTLTLIRNRYHKD